MKTMFAAIALTVALPLQPALADDDPCQTLYTFAETVMSARQSGVSMPKLMESIRETTSEGSDTALAARNIMTMMLKEAYDRPRWGTDGRKQEAIQDFANETAAACYEGVADED
jgi:hypothetical protein